MRLFIDFEIGNYNLFHSMRLSCLFNLAFLICFRMKFMFYVYLLHDGPLTVSFHSFLQINHSLRTDKAQNIEAKSRKKKEKFVTLKS